MRHIVILSILFAVLAAAVVNKELSRPEAGALRDEVALRGLGVGDGTFAAGDVEEIEIQGPGLSDSFRIRKDGEGWLILDPFAAPAAPGTVQKLLQTAAAARGDLRLDDPAKLASFDLSNDRGVRVTLRGATGDMASFRVGRTSGQKGAFVRLLHDPELSSNAYAVSHDLRSALGLSKTPVGETTPESPTPGTFHDTGIAPLALDSATRVELTSPRWKIVLAKAGAEWGVLEGAPDLPLKSSGVNALLSQLGGGLKASALVDPTRRGELGLDAAPYRVTVILDDGTRRSAVGVTDPVTNASYVRLDVERSPDVVYECSSYAWRKLFPAGGTLFDLPALDVADEGLGRITITRPDSVLDLRREGGVPQNEWEVLAPTWPLVARADLIRSLSALLRALRPVDFVDGPLDLEAEITIAYGADGAPDADLQRIRIAAETHDGGERLALLPGDGGRLMVLAGDAVDRLAPEVLGLFEPRPLHGWERDKITRIRVAEGGTELYALVQGETAWTLDRDGASGPADGLGVTRLVNRLVEMEVTAVAAASTGGARTVTLERTEGEPVTFAVHVTEGADPTIVIGGHAFTLDGGLDVPDADALVGAAAPEEQPGENPGEPGDPGGDE